MGRPPADPGEGLEQPRVEFGEIVAEAVIRRAHEPEPLRIGRVRQKIPRLLLADELVVRRVNRCPMTDSVLNVGSFGTPCVR